MMHTEGWRLKLWKMKREKNKSWMNEWESNDTELWTTRNDVGTGTGTLK